MSVNDIYTRTDHCQICKEAESKYCCPRCNTLYCSMTCYKAVCHSQCSEVFFRDCFMDEMTAMNCNAESKSKMLEILKRVSRDDHIPYESDRLCRDQNVLNDLEDFNDDSNKDSDDDDPIPNLAHRLRDTDLDDSDAVWNLLTEDERKEFESAVTNDIEKILPIWKPWWLYEKEKKLISIVSENDDEFDYKSACPKLMNNIKDFDMVAKRKPSSCIKYNILNVIFSYIHMVKLFNGDHYELYNEAIDCLILLSANLNKSINFKDIETALESVIQESLNYEAFSCSEEDKMQLKMDIQYFIRGPEESNGPFYILCALSDAINLLKRFKLNFKSNVGKEEVEKSENGKFSQKFLNKNKKSSNITKDIVKFSIKKIEYYLSFMKTYGNVLLTDLSMENL